VDEYWIRKAGRQEKFVMARFPWAVWLIKWQKDGGQKNKALLSARHFSAFLLG
jgi:hypothetical protein